MLIWPLWATPAHMAAWPRLVVNGAQTSSGKSRAPVAVFLCRLASSRARRSNLTGVRITPCWAASARSFRWRISNYRTVAPFWSERICFRPMRCCLMPIGMGSACWVAFLNAVSTTVRLGRHRFEARPNRTAVDRVGRGKERQVNIRFLAMTNHYVFEPQFCNPAAGWVEPVCRHRFETAGEGGKSRRTFKMPATACGSPCPASPILLH